MNLSVHSCSTDLSSHTEPRAYRSKQSNKAGEPVDPVQMETRAAEIFHYEIFKDGRFLHPFLIVEETSLSFGNEVEELERVYLANFAVEGRQFPTGSVVAHSEGDYNGNHHCIICRTEWFIFE